MISPAPPAAPRPPMPGPKNRLPGGQLIPFLRDPLGTIHRLSRRYGDFVALQARGRPIFIISDPDAIRDVFITHHRSFTKGEALHEARRVLGEGLLTSEGEFHRRQRRILQPAFQPRNIGKYAEDMIACAARQRERWSEGETLDIAQEMHRLTLAAVGTSLFGANLERDAEEIGKSLTVVLEAFRFVSFPFATKLLNLPLPIVKRFKAASRNLDATIYRLIEERRNDPQERDDLLSLLIRAQDDEEGTGAMTDLQVRDEAMTLFLAGHETMATALTWTWYLLSQNPDAEAKLHAELDSVLGGRMPTLAEVERLEYTERVFAESMRLYPPAWVVGRKSTEEVEIAGYVIPEGSLILMSQYLVHRDARHFPDPERFNPDHFLPQAKAERHRYAYFPFGGGPRNCIGESFAWMEGILLLATVAQRWRFRLAPGHPIQLLPLITLRSKHGMKMTAHLRKS